MKTLDRSVETLGLESLSQRSDKLCPMSLFTIRTRTFKNRINCLWPLKIHEARKHRDNLVIKSLYVNVHFYVLTYPFSFPKVLFLLFLIDASRSLPKTHHQGLLLCSVPLPRAPIHRVRKNSKGKVLVFNQPRLQQKQTVGVVQGRKET